MNVGWAKRFTAAIAVIGSALLGTAAPVSAAGDAATVELMPGNGDIVVSLICGEELEEPFCRGPKDEGIFRLLDDGSRERVTSRGYDRQPAFSRDGHKLAFTRCPFDDQCDLYLQIEGTETALTTRNANDHDPAWSPNGEKVAFARCRWDQGWRCGIWVITVATGAQQRLTESLPGRRDTFPSWSPDGDRILFNRTMKGGQPRIYQIRVDGSGVAPFGPDEDQLYRPVWGPQGNRVLAAGPTYSQLLLMTSKGAETARIKPGCRGVWSAGFSPDGRLLVYVCEYDDGDAFAVDTYRLVDGEIETVFDVPYYDGFIIVDTTWAPRFPGGSDSP